MRLLNEIDKLDFFKIPQVDFDHEQISCFLRQLREAEIKIEKNNKKILLQQEESTEEKLLSRTQ